MTKQTKTDNLNYLMDPTFNKVNRLFALSFENKDDRPFFPKYYTPKFETKGFNVLTDGIMSLMCYWKTRRNIPKDYRNK